MRESYDANQLELDELWHRRIVKIFTHSVHGADDVEHRIPLVVQRLQARVRVIDVPLQNERKRVSHDVRMRLIAHSKHVFLVHHPETERRRLQVIQRLSHVPIRGEHDRL